MRRIHSTLRATASAIALVSAVPAFAQSDNNTQSQNTSTQNSGIPDIIVTATKQAEALSKVPISISALSQEQLDQQSVRTFRDIATLTPGVTFTPGTHGNGAASDVSIRGISSGSGTATVGVYIDETPVQVRPSGNYDSSNPYPRLFDLDRVEILRGPQGTLFGAGSEGGTIRFITPEPSLTQYSVYGRSEMAMTKGGDPSYEAGVAVGGPIIEDKLGFRVSVWARHDGGYVDKVDWFDRKDVEQRAGCARRAEMAARAERHDHAVDLLPEIARQRFVGVLEGLFESGPEPVRHRQSGARAQRRHLLAAVAEGKCRCRRGDVRVRHLVPAPRQQQYL